MNPGSDFSVNNIKRDKNKQSPSKKGGKEEEESTDFSSGIEELFREDDRLFNEQSSEKPNDADVGTNDDDGREEDDDEKEKVAGAENDDDNEMHFVSSSMKCLPNLKPSLKKKKPWYMACLEREDVLRLVIFSVLFILFTSPIFIPLYQSYFPLFFDTSTSSSCRYNTVGLCIASCIASILNLVLVRANI